MELFNYLARYFIAPIFAGFFILLCLALVWSRYKYNKKQRKAIPVQDKIDGFLTILALEPHTTQSVKEEVRKFVKTIPFHKTWCKELFLNSIIDFKESVKGKISKEMLDIYVIAELHKFSLKLIKDRRWYVKSLGFYHFQSLNFVHGQKYVKPYLNDANTKLRSNAYISYLYLTTEPLDFLVDYKDPILKVSEYKAINILYDKKIPMPSNIDLWLDSSNRSIVKLGIKIMVFYNYSGASEKLISLLHAEDESLRFEVILAAKELYLLDSEDALIELFDAEDSLKNQKAILNTLSLIGGEKSINLALSLSTNELLNRHLRLEAVHCIYALAPERLSNEFINFPDVQKMVDHVKNPYLLAT